MAQNTSAHIFHVGTHSYKLGVGVGLGELVSDWVARCLATTLLYGKKEGWILGDGY